MVFYHFYIITTPILTRSALVTILKNTAKIITERGGVVRSLDNLGVRHLAYMMKRHQTVATVGRYVRVQLDCGPDVVEHLEHAAKNDESVLRWLVVKQKEGVAAMKPSEKKKYEKDLKKAIALGNELETGFAGMAPRDIHQADVNGFLKTGSSLGIAQDSNFWRFVLEKLKNDNAAPESIRVALSRFVGAPTAVERLTERMELLMEMAVRDARGKILVTPWWKQEANVVEKLKQDLEYKSKVRRPHQVQFRSESLEVLGSFLEADKSLVVYLNELLDQFLTSSSILDASDTNESLPGLMPEWAIHMDAVASGKMSIGDCASKLEQLFSAYPKEVIASVQTLLDGVEKRVASRQEEKNIREKELNTEVAVMETATLHHLDHAHKEFERLETDMMQGPLPRFKL